MATKKATKKAVKFPDTMFITKDEWTSEDGFYMASKDIETCAAEKPVRVGVYQLVGYKDVTKVTEIKVEDVNG